MSDQLETLVAAAAPATEPVNAEVSEPNAPTGEAQDPQAIAKESETETKEQEQKRLSGYQREKLKRERAEQEAEFWRKQALKGSEPKPSEPAKAEPKVDRPWADPSDLKPRMSTFEGDLDQYEDAKDAWFDREFDRKQAYLSKQKETEAQQKTATQKWEATKTALVSELEDFEEVSDAAIDQIRSLEKQPGIPALAAFAAHPDFGPRFLYELGKLEPAELKRIASLSDPREVAFEAGKIHARLAQVPTPPVEAEKASEPPPPVSRAPKPVTPITKPSPSDNGALRDDLPVDEWAKRFRRRMESR